MFFQAEKLELALADRNREVHNLRVEVHERRRAQHKLRLGQHWFSEEGMSLSMGSLAVSITYLITVVVDIKVQTV